MLEQCIECGFNYYKEDMKPSHHWLCSRRCQKNLNSETEVDHPHHYTEGTPSECIEIIEALGLDYHLGSAFAYIWRHKRKGGRRDIEKARWFLDRWLANEASNNEEMPGLS